MKNLQKFILPALVLATIAVIYLFFFSPHKGLDSFTTLDPDNHTQKEFKVKLLIEEGIDTKSNPAKKLFFVQDKNGMKMQVAANEIPQGFETAENIIIVGHSHGQIFEAAEVRLD